MALTYPERQKRGEAEVARILAGIRDEKKRALAQLYIQDRRGRGDKAEAKPWSTQVRDATAIEYLCRYMEHHCPGMDIKDLAPDDMRGFLDWMLKPRDPSDPGASAARAKDQLSLATRGGAWIMLLGFLKWTTDRQTWRKGGGSCYRMPPHPAVDFDVEAEYTLTTESDLEADDLLVPNEIRSMYDQAKPGKERWAIGGLGETGFRNNEVCKLNDKSYVEHIIVRHSQTGALVPSGKLTLPARERYKTEVTQRTIGIVASVPALMEVMREHPFAAYFERRDLQVPLIWTDNPAFSIPSCGGRRRSSGASGKAAR